MCFGQSSRDGQNIVEGGLWRSEQAPGQALDAFFFPQSSRMFILTQNPRPTASMSLQEMSRVRAWRSALIHRNSTLLRAERFASYSQRARLSSSSNDASQKGVFRKPGASASPAPNPSYPAFSFQGLGANRTGKVVVIACLTVVATVESIFWVKVLWAKFSPSRENESKPEGN